MAGSKIKQISQLSQLVDGLKECWPEFYMAPNEFINPSLNSVIKFYERFISEFGVNLDTILTLFNQNYDQFQKYEDIMYVHFLYSCASCIYRQLELGSFELTFKNFINPTDDKSLISRTLLLANFLYYVKVTSQNNLIPIKEQVLGEIDILDDLEQEVSKKNEELKIAVFTITNSMDKIEKLKINKKKTENLLNITQLESEELNKTIQNLTVELKLYEDENATLTDNIENNMKKKIKYESLVVDHEAILVEQNKAEKELAEEELQLSEHMKNIELKTSVESNLTKNCEAINNFIETFNLPKVLDMYNLIEELRNEKEKFKKESHTFLRIEKEARNLKDQLPHQLKDVEEKLLALNLKSNNRLQTLRNEAIQLNKEHNEVNNEYKRSINDYSEMDNKFQYFTNCCDQYQQEIEKQEQNHQTLFKKFLDVETLLNNQVVSVLSLIQEKMAKIINTENVD